MLVFEVWKTDPVLHELSSLAAVHITALLLDLTFGVLHQKRRVEALWSVPNFGKEMKPQTSQLVGISKKSCWRKLKNGPDSTASSTNPFKIDFCEVADKTDRVQHRTSQKKGKRPTCAVPGAWQEDIGSNMFESV